MITIYKIISAVLARKKTKKKYKQRDTFEHFRGQQIVLYQTNGKYFCVNEIRVMIGGLIRGKLPYRETWNATLEQMVVGFV